jgi:DNA-binding ferritin-like protein
MVRSPNFVGLHDFYGEAYAELDNWYDRFAERARAEEEKAEAIDLAWSVPKGDCIGEAKEALESLDAEASDERGEADDTTAAMIDELREYLGKLLWQLKAMS